MVTFIVSLVARESKPQTASLIKAYSSICPLRIRNIASKANSFGSRTDPSANFYFGGFGNNVIAFVLKRVEA